MTKFWKRIKLWYQKRSPKWYQSQTTVSKKQTSYSKAWKFILEQAKEANDYWYVQPELVSPARDSLSGLSNE